LRPALERKLVLAAGEGDPAARITLVETFLPLIAGVARRYRSSGAVERVDLMQEGVVGLLRALERYDPEVGASFWAYASWWVRQAMQQLVAELARPTVLSDRALRQLARVKDAHRVHLQAHGSEPSNSDLAAETGLTRDQVESLLAVERTPRGLDDPLGYDEGDVRTYGDRLVDPRAEDAYDGVVQRLEADGLDRVEGRLSQRERTVLRARYGMDRPSQTLREIAGGLGLSAERVRQIEEGALGKLREAWESAVA
jgi:RNA polymerase sigma factor (sigma-70 family)